MVAVFFRRIAQELHDSWVLFFAPGVPALLPWRWAWACYRALCRFPLILETQLRSAANIVVESLPGTDTEAVIRRLRLLRILDFADLYLARRTAVTAPPAAHFVAHGQWPAGAFVAVSFHYGNGMWMLRDLLRRGHRSVVVAAPFEPGDFTGRRVYFAYARARHREMERSAGIGAAYRPHVREKLLTALARGDVVMSLLDLPPRLVAANQRPVQLLGSRATLPTGILQLAAAAGVPLVPFWIETDARGIRTLVIGEPRAPDDIDANLAYFAGLLDDLIRRDPAAWHFWSEWPAWQAASAIRSPT